MDPRETTEKVLGLDPRDLFARARETAPMETGAVLRNWVPPDNDQMAELFPQFEIVGLLGRGAMGAVYHVRQPALDRDVALKLLPAEAASDLAFAERFRAEARALARLQHPHIVAIYESGQTESGNLFFVMEYVEGGDLAKLMAKGPLPARRALEIARAVCDALEYAHARTVIHRDIKPANVLLGKDGVVKVADFGLARLHVEKPDTSRLTAPGTALGTPAYMSPEQRAGELVDGRADLYSLGVMLYEMLTGDLPQGAWRPPSHKTDAGTRLDTVVQKVMQTDPRDRVQTASEMRRRLDLVLHSMTPAMKRRKLILAGLGTALAGGAGWYGWKAVAGEASDSPHASPPGSPVPYPSSPGSREILPGIDLKRAAYAGEWAWADQPGGTLVVAYDQDKSTTKVLHLPISPRDQGYDLTGEIQFDSVGSDLVFVMPAGHSHVALVLDLHDHSGLEFIGEANWRSNPTTVPRRLPKGRFLALIVKIRPAGERVTIVVLIDGDPFIQWEGQQSELALTARNYPAAVVDKSAPLTVQSARGGSRLRALKVTIL